MATILAGDFFKRTKSPPRVLRFDLYRMTVYAHSNARAEWHHAQAQAEYNPFIWAWVASNIGLYRILTTWQAITHRDKEGRAIAHDMGILMRTQASMIEPEALANLDKQAVLWLNARGRLHITPFEAEVLTLEREYMSQCQTQAFRVRWGDRWAGRKYQLAWRPDPKEKAFTENVIDKTACRGWIAMRLARSPYSVKDAIVKATRVLELRASLELPLDLPVREEIVDNRYELAA